MPIIVSPSVTAPVAPVEPYTRVEHSDRVDDPYRWMADKTDPRLLRYLTAENEYTAAVTAPLAGLRDELYADLDARTQQTDLSVPSFVTHTSGDSFWYYTRTVEGLDYPIHCRVAASGRDQIPDVGDAPLPDETVLLDVNALAEGEAYCALGWADVSPDGRLLGYSVDVAGDERYDLVVKEIATGETVGDPILGVGAGGAWAGDDWVFYLRVDAAWRPHEVWRHRLGTPPAGDVLVLAEPDERFWMGVDAARGYEWVLIEIGSPTTTECHLIPTATPDAAPRCVARRRPGVDYTVEVAPDALYILHNDGAQDFMLSRAPVESTSPDDWTTVIPARRGVRLNGVTAYTRGLLVSQRVEGLTGLAFLRRLPDGSLGDPQPILFAEPLYTVGAEEDPHVDTDRVRLMFESLATPPELIEYQFDTGERRVLKRTPVRDHPRHGPFDPSAYVQERLWATAPDGVEVPLSVIRPAGVPLDGSAPCLLYGYGSYEVSIDPFFSISRLSLLDRGYVVAIAHVRGGGELGRSWYESGKLDAKPTTFTDFIACARHLVDAGYTSPERLAIEGGSAGGLLIGAVMNLAPDLCRAAHAAVPFVDALTTILNPELPLSVMEWEEWGDPLHDPRIYDVMKSYSPYENVRAARYPAILATTSLNDTRVEVTEPAKWIARLRATATNGPDRPILLRTEMVAGHGGVSGRYAGWRDRAFELAWIIDQTTR